MRGKVFWLKAQKYLLTLIIMMQITPCKLCGNVTYQKDGHCIICKTGNKRVMKCKKCGTNTNQKDNVCVLCEIGIEQVHDELMSLIKDRRFSLLLRKWNIKLSNTI